MSLLSLQTDITPFFRVIVISSSTDPDISFSEMLSGPLEQTDPVALTQSWSTNLMEMLLFITMEIVQSGAQEQTMGNNVIILSCKMMEISSSTQVTLKLFGHQEPALDLYINYIINNFNFKSWLKAFLYF